MGSVAIDEMRPLLQERTLYIKMISTLKSFSVLVVMAITLLAVPAIEMAGDAATKASLTFSQAIKIPGVVLVPGTYVFKTMGSDNHVVQVWDAKEKHLYATLMTRVDHLNKPATKTQATFGERVGGAPPTLKTLQVMNENNGMEFLYGPTGTAISPAVSDAVSAEAERKATKYFDSGCFLWTCQ
jgi:hypothetical protein